MKNFEFIKAILFGAVLFLAGCTEIRDQTPPQITTYEALNMQFDVSTKDQVEDILKSYGYSVENEAFNAQDIINRKEFKDLPKSAIILLTKLKEKQSVIKVPVSADKEWMKFVFDKNQKLIAFAAQGRKSVLDPLIVHDNKSREVLINFNSDHLSNYVKSKRKDTWLKEKWDLILYMGKDLSFAYSVHTESMKDMTIYFVVSPGSIYQAILSIRDFFKLARLF